MKKMTINNMITGDMVQTRNGKFATVMKDTPIGDVLRYHTAKNSFSYIAVRYNDDMTHKDHNGLDIMKVYRIPGDLAANVAGDVVANPEKMAVDAALIWDRDNPVFDINDLQTGDMVKTRGGKLGTVYLNTLIGDIIRYHTEKNSFSYLTNFTTDLKSVKKDSFDIVEVYRSLIYSTTDAGDAFGNPDKMVQDGNLIYKRDEVAFEDEIEDDVQDDDRTDWETATLEVAEAPVRPTFTLTDEQFDRLLGRMWG